MFLVIVLVTGCVNESYYESQNHEVDDLFEYKEVESDIVMNFIDSDSKEKDIIYIAQKNKTIELENSKNKKPKLV